MKTISRARKNFRIVLGVMFIAAFGFCATASYFYVAVKNKNVRILDIAPTLFAMDITQYKVQAFFSPQETDHIIAVGLMRKGLFSPLYADAGVKMIAQLADQGYPPSQLLHGDLMLRNAPQYHEDGLRYIRAAADQGYEPAIERMAAFEHPNIGE